MSPTDRARSNGYNFVRQLPDGRIIGLAQMFATVGLVVGIEESGYSHRYCYPTGNDAFQALMKWDGSGDPPGPWIKQKGLGVDRENPKVAFLGIPLVTEHRGPQDLRISTKIPPERQANATTPND